MRRIAIVIVMIVMTATMAIAAGGMMFFRLGAGLRRPIAVAAIRFFGYLFLHHNLADSGIRRSCLEFCDRLRMKEDSQKRQSQLDHLFQWYRSTSEQSRLQSMRKLRQHALNA